MCRRELLRRRNRHRNTRITATARMRRVTIVPAQIRRQRDVPLGQGALVRRAEHAVRRVDGGVGARGRRNVQRPVLAGREGGRDGVLPLSQKWRVARCAVQGVDGGRGVRGGVLRPEQGALLGVLRGEGEVLGHLQNVITNQIMQLTFFMCTKKSYTTRLTDLISLSVLCVAFNLAQTVVNLR